MSPRVCSHRNIIRSALIHLKMMQLGLGTYQIAEWLCLQDHTGINIPIKHDIFVNPVILSPLRNQSQRTINAADNWWCPQEMCLLLFVAGKQANVSSANEVSQCFWHWLLSLNYGNTQYGKFPSHLFYSNFSTELLLGINHNHPLIKCEFVEFKESRHFKDIFFKFLKWQKGWLQ